MAATRRMRERSYRLYRIWRWAKGTGQLRVFFLQLILAGMVLGSGCSAKPPAQKGERDGLLPPCPSSPNCVSSMGGKPGRTVSPLDYGGSRAQAMDDLLAVLAAMDGASVRKQQQDYLWAEFASKVFGFIDDVEFYLPPDQSLIHVRSASRVGYYDFGVNARRVEKIRKLFNERQLRR